MPTTMDRAPLNLEHPSRSREQRMARIKKKMDTDAAKKGLASARRVKEEKRREREKRQRERERQESARKKSKEAAQHTGGSSGTSRTAGTPRLAGGKVAPERQALAQAQAGEAALDAEVAASQQIVCALANGKNLFSKVS